MERTFRDILSQFLEENEAVSPSTKAASVENPSQVFEQTWIIDNTLRPHEAPINPPREEAVSRYQAQAPRPSEKVAAKPTLILTPPLPSVEVEVRISLEKLDKESRLMVGILLDLGAAELKDGVSLGRIKKAYRRLAKRYHPDRVNENSSEREREAAKVAFFKLQKAYEFLCESLAEDLVEAA